MLTALWTGSYFINALKNKYDRKTTFPRDLVQHLIGKKEVEKAEAKEADRARRFANTKHYLTALKKEQEWEAAKKKVLEARDKLEWLDEHYFKLIQQRVIW